MTKKLYYITRARIPSEKAHSFQIVKMCEAFANLGLLVTLVLPKRRNSIEVSLFSYYNLVNSFSLNYIWVPQLIRQGRIGRILFWFEGLIFILQLSWSLKVSKEDLIVTRSLEVALFYSLLKYQNIIFEVHDWPQSFSWLYKKMLRTVPRIVVTADGLKEECLKVGINPLVAPNGVDKSFFEEYIPLIKNDYGISNEKKVVMYVGALSKWKGVMTLLESSEYLPSHVQVVIAGGQSDEVQALKAQYPEVIFLGQTPAQDLVKYQALADILVVPNSAEEMVSSRFTSPIKLFAHLTSLKPIIVTNLPSMRSIVDEKEVVFFDGTATDLGQKIKHVLAMKPEELQSLTKAAYTKGKKFTWDKRAESIIGFAKSYA